MNCVLCTSSCNTAIIVVIPRKPRRVICACALRNCSNRVQTKENKTSGAAEMKEVISFLSFIIELRYQKKKKKKLTRSRQRVLSNPFSGIKDKVTGKVFCFLSVNFVRKTSRLLCPH